MPGRESTTEPPDEMRFLIRTVPDFQVVPRAIRVVLDLPDKFLTVGKIYRWIEKLTSKDSNMTKTL